MRRLTTFIVISFLASTAPPPMANDNHGIDFEAGKDASGIVAHAKEQGQMRRVRPLHHALDIGELPGELRKLGGKEGVPPLPQEPSNARGNDKRPLPLPSKVACDDYPVSGDDPGGSVPSLCGTGDSSRGIANFARNPALSPVTGPYEPIVRDDPDYMKALRLKGQLEGGAGLSNEGSAITTGIPGSGPVLAQFPPIAAQYDNFWRTAVALDRDDESLSAFGVRLNTWYDNLLARKKLLDSHEQTFNQLCTGRRLPADEKRQCDAYAKRHNNCVDAHNASLQRFNGLVKVWQDQKTCLQTKGNSFKSKFLDWIKITVLGWIGQADKVLDEGYGCKLTRIEKINNNPRWAVHCTYTCKSHPGERCGIAWAWDHDPKMGEIMAVCPDFSNVPPVMCPAPF